MRQAVIALLEEIGRTAQAAQEEPEPFVTPSRLAEMRRVELEKIVRFAQGAHALMHVEIEETSDGQGTEGASDVSA